MRASLTYTGLLAATVPALSGNAMAAGLSSRQNCEIPTCPDGWTANACNGGSPDFCCPGSSIINQGDASCCIRGGTSFSTNAECEGGILVSVGSDAEAYTSSVYAALSSVSQGDDASGGTTTSATTTTDDSSSATTSASAETITTTDASGNAVTSTQQVETTSSDDAAAAMVTGVSGVVVGVVAVVMIAGDMV